LIPIPTPLPTPFIPSPEFANPSCENYLGCEFCTSHYADRQCGWCNETQSCVEAEVPGSCNVSLLYYANNAICGYPVPPPDPTPWPSYNPDATFCYSLTSTWCENCVTKDRNMSCGWCHATKECVMGDEKGPYFLTCDDWSFGNATDRCLGKSSPSTILAVRIGVSIAAASIIILWIIGCYKVVKQPATVEYEQLK
jgi:hypothetical protein